MNKISICPVCVNSVSNDLCMVSLQVRGKQYAEIQLKLCKKCQLIWASKSGSERVLKEYFSTLAKYTFPDFATRTFETRKRVFEYVLKILDMASEGKGRILDVGSAYGHFLKMAEDRGWEVYGIEPSEAGCRYSTNSLGLRNIINGDIPSITLQEDFFDVITLLDSLYYFSDPLKDLVKLYKALKKGGILVVRITNVSILARLYVKLIPFKNTFIAHGNPFTPIGDAFYYFSEKTMRIILERAGFKVDKVIVSAPNRLNLFSMRSVFENLVYNLAEFIYFATFKKINIFPSLIIIGKKDSFCDFLTHFYKKV